MYIRILALAAPLLFSVGDMALAQTPVILEEYVCIGDTESEFRNDVIKGRKSDGICNTGTRMHITTSGDTHIASSITVSRLDEGPHRARVNISWIEGKYGIISIDVYYQRREHVGWGDCDWEPWTYMYTYKIYRLNVNPGGILDGATFLTATSPEVQSVFNFDYTPSSTYPSSLRAVKIRYSNGIQTIEKDISMTPSGTYVPTPVELYKKGFGQTEFQTEVQDDCGVWYPGPSRTLNVYPSCYEDIASEVKTSIAGPELISFPEGNKVEMNIPYSLHVSGITDFSSHYTWNAEDGGDDFLFEQNSFVLLKGLGSYRINADKKPGRELCPSIPPIPVFVGGRDVTISDDCPIVIPDIFLDPDFQAEFGYNIEPNDIVLQHFAATLISKRSITVKPGLTLTLGAELILNNPVSEPDPGDPDLKMNFVEQSAYDDYGRLILSSRSYFDNRGRGLQSQYKNLSRDVMMANATLFDSYGRPAISTLSAPVQAGTVKMADAGCGIESVGENVKFEYKEDFVGADNVVYNYRNFDIVSPEESKEENPDPLGNSQPGTLGWYYSENNGTATGDFAAMNEPLTASTSYPYSRTLYRHDGSGEVKGSTRPGDAFKAGSERMATANNETVSASDEYLDAYLDMRSKLGFEKPTSDQLEGNFFRTVVTDENTRKAITYTDKSRSAIISLYFGTDAITTSYQFYDNAGRLLVSVSPNGVEQYDGSNFDTIDKTTYKYNYKGWLLRMIEPDAGKTEYIYRRDGKIRFSQNAQQQENGSFSYTNYDRSGRPLESGEYKGTFEFDDGLKDILEAIGYEGGITNGTRSFWVRTYYDQQAEMLALDLNDESLSLPVPRTQRFVQGAVSCSRNENITTWYSYDERGRVEWMVQQMANASSEEFSIKTIDYRYGPTGAVQEVLYQKDKADQFTHFYEYDKDGRLVKVFTSPAKLEYNKLGEVTNPDVLSLQATYYYYLHGPLKRIELENELQGIDYVYTADGSLKAINHHDPAKDPAQDGTANDFMADVFGMTLDYYPQDYDAPGYDETDLILSGYDDHYSGIIKAVRWHGPVEPGKAHAYAFKYDDRYQLIEANWALANGTMLTFNPLVTNPYLESIGGYDHNGNIRSLRRNDNMGNAIADFNYHYEPNANRLKNIVTGNTEVRRYDYDKTGRMTYENKNDSESFIAYDVSGKVTGVYQERKFKVSHCDFWI